MKKIFIISFLMLSFASLAQDTRGTIKVKKTDVEPIVLYVDQMPVLNNMAEFIRKNIRYPKAEKEAGITGIVYIGFVVEIDGRRTDIRVLKGIPDGAGCDNEALRIVKMMPKWTPGKNQGKGVPVQCTLPIKFKL